MVQNGQCMVRNGNSLVRNGNIWCEMVMVRNDRIPGETGYSCSVPSAKLYLPILPWTSFQEMSQPE